MCAFSPTRHASRPPDVPGLLDVLRRRDVRYVLVGSVAASVHGVEVKAGDLDIAPALDGANLEKLIVALADLEAAPHGPFGRWTLLDSGEWKFVARPTTDTELAEWRPHARDLDSLDQLFLTRLGNFDVVPGIAGTYEILRVRAVLRICHGCDVWVAHVDDLLSRLTVPRREKDRARVLALREIQRQI